MKPVKRLDRDGLIELVTFFMSGGTKSDEEDVHCLMTIVANCPDPPAAMKLLVEKQENENPEDENPEAIVDRALRMPPRPAERYSPKELHPNHPLRRIRFE